MFIESKGLRVFLYQETIDMRSGFEKLLFYVRDKMKGQINQGHLYIFLGKNRRRIKALFYDGTGLVLVAKRIERGRFMDRSELKDITEITTQELKQVFNGGLIVRPRVERSMITQVGPASLPRGFEQ
jgi:transposase